MSLRRIVSCRCTIEYPPQRSIAVSLTAPGAETVDPSFKAMFSRLWSSQRFQHEMDGLWAAIQSKLGRNGKHTFLVSAASEGEGATTVAMGLGRFVAETTGKHVLLVDADWHGNVLRDLVGEGNLVPIIEEPSDRYAVTFDEYATNVANLNYLCFRNPHALETLVMHREDMAIFVDLITKRYDYVFVDTPAVLLSNVAPFLARQLDTIIFVIAAGNLRYPVLLEALSRYEGVKDRILGAVLNKRQYPLPYTVYRFFR